MAMKMESAYQAIQEFNEKYGCTTKPTRGYKTVGEILQGNFGHPPTAMDYKRALEMLKVTVSNIQERTLEDQQRKILLKDSLADIERMLDEALDK